MQAEASKDIPLGPFLLTSLLGRGGMGEVWRARHAREGVDVAVKLVTAEHASRDTYQEGFRREAEAVARLIHPHIATIWDCGVTGSETEMASEGRFPKGTPWLAMELVEWGHLSAARIQTWDVLQRVLLEILDALAHAHARGFIHRDLKPENTLVARGGAIKLTDFGIAYALDRVEQSDTQSEDKGETESVVMGTPTFMAPEQFAGQWRDYGPWTDLYSLGCVAFELATGRPPYLGATLRELAQLHTKARIPNLKPRFPLPPEFEEWVRTLLAKDPNARFSFAADATWTLLKLGPPAAMTTPNETPERGDPSSEHPTIEPSPLPRATDADSGAHRADSGSSAAVGSGEFLSVSGSFAAAAPEWLRPVDSPSDAPPAGDLPSPIGLEPGFDELFGESPWDIRPAGKAAAQHPNEEVHFHLPRLSTLASLADPAIDASAPLVGALLSLAPLTTPPIPPTWRREGMPRVASGTQRGLVGVGLGLFGLREIPFVGRGRERDIIWRALRKVADQRTAQCVIVEGSAGCGKTRLVEWMAQRAEELGAARLVKVRHHNPPSLRDGLPHTFTNLYGCAGLERAQAMKRMHGLLTAQGVDDPQDWRSLTELVCPGREERSGGMTPPARSQLAHFAAIHRVFARMAAQRPVIVWIEDAHWGHHSLELVRFLLDQQALGGSALLVLVTVQNEALARRVAVQRLISQLGEREEVKCIALAPLDEEAQRNLVASLLPLEARTARAIVARTGGNPRFAVDLLSDWVQREVIVAGPSGFAVDGADHLLPESIAEVWQERLVSVLEGTPTRWRGALELAAVLGQDVVWEEWSNACEHVGFPAPPGLVRHLVAARLCERTGAGFRLAHVALRESLLKQSDQGERRVRWNAACAAVLAPSYDAGVPGAAARYGVHLARAGQGEASIQPLLTGAQWAAEQSRYNVAERLADIAAGQLRKYGDADDVRWARVYFVRIMLKVYLELLDEAEVIAMQAVQRAYDAGWEAALPRLLLYLGWVHRLAGRPQQAQWAYKAAVPRFAASDDRAGLAEIYLELGDLAQYAGQLGEAHDLLSKGLDIAATAGDEIILSTALHDLAVLAVSEGRLDNAEDLFRRALELHRHLGRRFAEASSLNGLANIARIRGDLDTAGTGYREADAIYAAIGAESGRVVPLLNLGLIELRARQFTEARTFIESALVRAKQGGREGLVAAAKANLLPVIATDGDPDELELHITQTAEALNASGIVDADIAWPIELAGDIAWDNDQQRLAQRAWRIAERQWRQLERALECARIADKLGEQVKYQTGRWQTV